MPAPDGITELEIWCECLRDVTVFAREFLEVSLHEGQQRWLEESHRRENILITGNRWGKSFVSAIKLLHHAIFRPRCRIYDRADRYRAVIVSISQDQANIVFEQTVRLARSSPIVSRLIESVLYTPHPTLTFSNGATIESRSSQNRGQYLLGNDFDLCIFDEAAFETAPEQVVEEVILMRLADREGKLDLVSTPNGKNWLYARVQEIVSGHRAGYVQIGDSRDNPHISQDYVAERVAGFSESRVRQNIMGQFVDSGAEIIRSADIEQAMARFARRQPGPPEYRTYLSGWDLARKRTATVGITVTVENGIAYVTALERFRWLDWEIVLQHIRARQEQYPGTLVIDSTGLGDVIIEQLRDFHPLGVIFTPQTKAELLTNLELLHSQGKIAYGEHQLPDGPGRQWSFCGEIRSARWDDNNQCDSVMALALAVWPLKQASSFTPPPRLSKV